MTARVTSPGPLLEVKGLRMHFPVTEGIVSRRLVGEVKAVDGVDFTVRRGETLGLVGESGCGKTTTGRCILRLEKPTAGEIIYDGVDIAGLDRKELVALRRRIQVIFQDPYASLNPRMKVGEIIAEPMYVHAIQPDAGKRAARVRELLSVCGLTSGFADRYPHEMSGGQRQRVGIARALALEPEFIVCDEPVSALDVSIRSQILNLLRDLQDRLGLAYIFVSHDLAVVKHIADRVAVMNLGRIVETAPADRLFAAPRHPYSHALLSAIPIPDPKARRDRIILQGDMPSALAPPSGCRFHTRCAHAIPRCREESPRLIDDGGHATACHRWTELPARPAPASDSASSPALERLMAAFSRVPDVEPARGVDKVEAALGTGAPGSR